MDLPGLRYFIAVAEQRHFRRAAVQLGISQPPLSARIRSLELELGVRLLHRGAGAPVSLTPAGAELLPLAREIIARVEAAKSAVARVRRGQVGALAVAAEPGVPDGLLADGIRRFRAGYPEIEVTLSEMDVQHQLDEVFLIFKWVRAADRPRGSRRLHGRVVEPSWRQEVGGHPDPVGSGRP